jgi:hypothetical protein
MLSEELSDEMIIGQQSPVHRIVAYFMANKV